MERQRINVYVDDLRDCPKGFQIARTVEEAQSLFQNHEVVLLSLDHDLGEDESGKELKNGYDFVKWFCEEGKVAEKIYLHTDNPVGRTNMYETLKAAKRRGFITDGVDVFPYPIVPNRYSGETGD